ncbi:hypothetical protein SALBM217S_04417 [Streptomyces griseoloalbus]
MGNSAGSAAGMAAVKHTSSRPSAPMPAATASSPPSRISSSAGTDSARKPAQPAAITGRRPTRSVSAPANGCTTIISTITPSTTTRPCVAS